MSLYRELYEINEQILACCTNVDEETGELLNVEQLEALEMERGEKLESIALLIKDLSANAADIRAEEKNLAERRHEIEQRAERLKSWLAQELNGERLDTPRCVVSWRKTTSLNITDLGAIPADFLKFADPAPDKNAIKAAIKAGREIDGAELVESTSMTIK